jgi:hypothetical protein
LLLRHLQVYNTRKCTKANHKLHQKTTLQINPAPSRAVAAQRTEHSSQQPRPWYCTKLQASISCDLTSFLTTPYRYPVRVLNHSQIKPTTTRPTTAATNPSTTLSPSLTAPAVTTPEPPPPAVGFWPTAVVVVTTTVPFPPCAGP